MPNAANVVAPITLIGLGRSGTTLLEACFNAHPEIQTLNETGGMIFGLAAGAFESPLPAKQHFSSNYGFAGHAIRTTLTALEPSDKPYWFHKPGGLPKLINWQWQEGQRTPSSFPVEWYWRVMKAAFPSALFMTCLRNPWDVVLSWERYIGWRQEDIWQDVADIYAMLDFGAADIQRTIFFDDLIGAPEATLRSILSSAGIPYDDAVVAGFLRPQAMRPGDMPMKSHGLQWDRCVARRCDRSRRSASSRSGAPRAGHSARRSDSQACLHLSNLRHATRDAVRADSRAMTPMIEFARTSRRFAHAGTKARPS